MTPPRVQAIITAALETNEVGRAELFNGSQARQVVLTRRSIISTLIAQPKPNGRLPSNQEVADWMCCSEATVRAVRGKMETAHG